MDIDKLIRRSQMLELIGVSHSTQWPGQFPARVKLGPGSVGWHLAEVEEWVKRRERVGGSSRQAEGATSSQLVGPFWDQGRSRR